MSVAGRPPTPALSLGAQNCQAFLANWTGLAWPEKADHKTTNRLPLYNLHGFGSAVTTSRAKGPQMNRSGERSLHPRFLFERRVWFWF